MNDMNVYFVTLILIRQSHRVAAAEQKKNERREETPPNLGIFFFRCWLLLTKFFSIVSALNENAKKLKASRSRI